MTATATAPLSFDQPELLCRIDTLDDAALDELPFGVIGFDSDTVVRRYNAFESRCAGLSPQRVMGHKLFTTVAPCMNNFMVAQRFDDATASGSALDETINYVLTLRMRPVKVRLRLLRASSSTHSYVLVHRPA